MTLLKSNSSWGRRSGAIHKEWGIPVFRQQQWGSGASRSQRQKTLTLINVNSKWFR